MKKRVLSAFLALCLVLTLVPMAALAAGTGTEEDPILIAADTSALQDGKYYKLQEDVTLTGQLTIGDGVTAYLDLESGTLTAAAKKYAIQVNAGGTLHITGTQGIVAGSDYGALRNSGGTITIAGGTFASSWRISVKNEDGAKGGNQVDGDMTISGGTFICNKEPMDQAVQNFCKLKIEGGEFRGKVVTWQEVGTGYADYGDTTITGGTFIEDVLIAQSKGKAGTDETKAPKLSISGADTKFEKDVGFFEGNTDATNAADIKGTLTIQDATVEGTVYNGSKGTVEINNAKVNNVSNKVGGKDAGTVGTGSIAVKESIVTGTIDDSVNLVSNCTNGSGGKIEDVYASNTGLTLVQGDESDGFPGMCTLQISGVQADKYYIVRIADSEDRDTNSVILPLSGDDIQTGYTFACKSGKYVILWEFSNKDELKEQNLTPLTQKTLTSEYVPEP